MSTRTTLTTLATGIMLLPLLASCSGAGQPAAGQIPAAIEADAAPVTGELAQDPEAQGVVFKGLIMGSGVTYLDDGLFWVSGYGTFDETGQYAGWAPLNEHPIFPELSLEIHNEKHAIFVAERPGNELGEGDQVVVSLDPKTGEVIWENTDMLGISWEPLDDDTVYSDWSGNDGNVAAWGGVTFYDLNTGKEQASFKNKTEQSWLMDSDALGVDNTEPFIIMDGTVEDGLVGRFKELNIDDGSVIKEYSNETLPDYPAEPAFEDGRNFDTTDGTLSLLDAGEQKQWSVKTKGRAEAWNEKFTLVEVDDRDQYVVLNTENGEILGTIAYSNGAYDGCGKNAEFIDEAKVMLTCEDETGSQQSPEYSAILDLNF